MSSADYLATQLQETGRLTVFTGDEQAALNLAVVGEPPAASWRDASRALHASGDDEPYGTDDALPASTESTGAGETHVDYLATQLQETGRLTVFPGDEQAALAALRAIGVESFTIYAGAASGGVPAALDVERLASEWEATAHRLGERLFAGDPTAALATINTLQGCAAALRRLARSASEPAE